MYTEFSALLRDYPVFLVVNRCVLSSFHPEMAVFHNLIVNLQD
jgi:hypothetical protein